MENSDAVSPGSARKRKISVVAGYDVKALEERNGAGEPKKVSMDIRKAMGMPVEKSVPTATLNTEKIYISVVEEKYRMKFPVDFEFLWDFCSSISPNRPKSALKESLGLTLAGPFDLLDGKTVSEPTLHFRYHRDPPEFHTLLVAENDPDDLHYGYFRDDPNEMPSFVASAAPKKGPTMKYRADHLLELICNLCSNKITKLVKAQNASPQETLDLENLNVLKSKIEKFAEKENISLNCGEKGLKTRKKQTQGTTFHKLGISVPVKNDIGYRPIHHDDKTLMKMMEKVVNCSTQTEKVSAFSPLHEQINFVQFANDESDFGMGLELGIDFFMHGSDCFHKTIQKLLPAAYKFLKRDLYAEIVEKHLAKRETCADKISYLQ